jgi:formylglycine-generating enzyme required for sulfatase activity/tRNA A-37 threonylcarbamoyl transferase component Bud32
MARPLPEIFGRYCILRPLGAGAMGTVYLARDTELDRLVALKVPRLSDDEQLAPHDLQRFLREARAAAALLHPNLCPIFDAGQVDGTPYLTMAYLEGRPLSNLVEPGLPLGQRQAVLIVRRLATALQEAHARGVIHRDLKPANVMITPRGEPIVMDFGLARRDQTAEARLTKDGTLLGTPAYMAPEQVRGEARALGPSCDIYALGVIFYKLLTGRLPFEGSVLNVLGKILTEEPPRPSEYRPDLDPRLEAICLKAMAKKGDDRYASMAELAAALTELLRSMPKGSRPAPDTDPAAERWSRSGDDPAATVPEPSLFVRPEPEPERTPVPAKAPAPRPGWRDRVQERGRTRASLPGWLLYAVAGAAVLVLLLGYALLEEFQHGWIKVTLSEPDAAVDVVLDGKPIATGGRDEPIRLTTGEHHLRVAGSSYQPWRRTFTVQHGSNPALTIPLAPIAPPPRPAPPSIQPAPSPSDDGAKKPASAPPEPRPAPPTATEVVKKEAEPKAVTPAPVFEPEFLTTRLGQIKLKRIPAGTFLMGSPDDDKVAESDEKPRRGVRISRPFYLGVYEVTQAQYHAVTGQNPSYFSSTGAGKSAIAGQSTDQHPVETVSWLDAVRFCNTLSERESLRPFYQIDGDDVQVPDWTGPGYRLPTEAEWEYACRAGSTTRYGFGDDERELSKYAWLGGAFEKGTHAAGQKQPNAFGLYDMHGNVWEWCWDWYDAEHYKQMLNINLAGPSWGTVRVLRGGSFDNNSANLRLADRRRKMLNINLAGPSWGTDRVLRGGSFFDNPANLRSADRRRIQPALRLRNLGFRLARTYR